MKRKGFSLIEMMIVIAIIGILLSFTVFSSITARQRIYRNICKDNLRRIHTVKELYANEHNKDDICLPTAADLNPYIKGGTTTLICPVDPNKSFATSYSINNIGTSTPPTCRIKDDHRIIP